MSSAGSELSVIYHISDHQHYRNQQEEQDYMNRLQEHRNINSKAFQQRPRNYHLIGQSYHNNTMKNDIGDVSPSLSVASSSSSTISSIHSYHSQSKKNNTTLSMPAQPPKPTTMPNTNSTLQQQQQQQQKRQNTTSCWNFTWLVFMNEKWVPFDIMNQTKLEQTLTVGGTFVDITDSHFPDVKRVRVFPRNNYLSYLGVKYRLSRIMQPDAYLDHVAVAEAKQPLTEPTSFSSLQQQDVNNNNNNNNNNNRNRRTWEI